MILTYIIKIKIITGTAYLKEGNLQKTRIYYEKALQIREKKYGKNHIETQADVLNLGILYQ